MNYLILVWPNPASSVVNINYIAISDQKVSLSINDLQGRLVYNKLISDGQSEIRESIDVSNLSKGTYILSIIEGTNKVNHKIIVD